MANKSGVAEQILSLPKGGGALKGLGEKFQPDLHTGTGNFSIPIALPPGRNGFAPELSLSYSTGAGNEAFGLGWSVAVPRVSRKTSKGIPRYDDRVDSAGDPAWHPDEDVFVLSGAEDLVYVGDGAYRPRTEGLFVRIQKAAAADGAPCWTVAAKNGLRSVYGKTRDSRLVAEENGAVRIFEWLLSETEDPFGNRIIYRYKRDDGADLQADLATHPTERNRSYNQVYLKSIAYVNFKPLELPDERFLWRIEFDYGEYDAGGEEVGGWDVRPDPFSSYRSGFEIRTSRRGRRILVKRRLDGPDDQFELIRSYELQYQQAPLSNTSLLSGVVLHGHNDGTTESFPPLTFGYTAFDPTQRQYEALAAPSGYLPERSLGDPSYEMIDLLGNGLPGIIHTGQTGYRYWRNLGNLQLAFPRQLRRAPAGVTVADDGVQFADMNGNGSADLLVTAGAARGYYANDFSGEWQEFHHYHQAPSFDLRDPNVRLVDVDGDGVTDILATHQHHFLYIRNTNHGDSLAFANPAVVERKHDLNEFPDVFFAAPDQRVRLADMSGDGMQDIVLIHDRLIQYWPNLGHGAFGKQVTMWKAPDLPPHYDPRRLFLSDLDGDGLADLLYVDFGTVHLWINRGGNRWSDEIIIHGTPPVTDADSVRVADLKGTGTAGILWTYDHNALRDSAYKFLDLTGGVKPHLLSEVSNHIGAVTRIAYAPSTLFYLEDEAQPETRWKMTLPFPVQVVARVEVIDAISGGKLTTEYRYHHGYWDGAEREFRGFGRVDQRDSEVFGEFNANGLHGDQPFERVAGFAFSPPTESRTWFHQGSVGHEFGEWEEIDFSGEFWSGDPETFARPRSLMAFLDSLPRRAKRDALRALRGSILRSELYALDGTQRQDRPYTVTESLYAVREESPPGLGEGDHIRIFFPHALAQRTTQWERGNDPMTQFVFTGDYDPYGQPHSQINIAVPRARDVRMSTIGGDPYLTTHRVTAYAQRDDTERYIVDRVAGVITYEILNDGSAPLLDFAEAVASGAISRRVIGQTLHFFDGSPFQGLPFGQIGDFGALVRSEALVLTEEILREAYKGGMTPIDPPERPPYLDPAGPPAWTGEYPDEFRTRLPTLAGYSFQPRGIGSEVESGYFSVTERRRYDFHEAAPTAKASGLVTVARDPLGHDTTIAYDSYQLLPTEIADAALLTTRVAYDYRVAQPSEVADLNGNRTTYSFTPSGLLEWVAVMGRRGDGDTVDTPGTRLAYDFLGFAQRGEPISVRTIRRVHHINEIEVPLQDRDGTIETVEYSDGFGRVLQTRTQAEDVLFGDPLRGDTVLPRDQSDHGATRKDVIGRQGSTGDPNVVVSGWQMYDNKGRVAEKYSPYFSTGWSYARPRGAQRAQKVTFYYDPRGQVVRLVNPDGSEQQIVHGVPGSIAAPDLVHPEMFEPTPWEVYTYDVNDNAGRTHPVSSGGYGSHRNTPTSMLADALGRTVVTVERNGPNATSDWYTTRATYDVRGNLLRIEDTLGRDAFRYVYDFANRVLRIEELDAGVRRAIIDAGGNLVEQRDSKGGMILHTSDAIQRPIRLWARDDATQAVTLRERLSYGDSIESGMTRAEGADRNLLGRLFKHYDEAGLLTVESCDFKGNVLEKVRHLISDEVIASPVDPPPVSWQVPAFRVNWQPQSSLPLDDHARQLLDVPGYRTSFTYDALNRSKSMLYPLDVTGERKKLRPRYNRAGVLERLELAGIPLVEYIARGANGQRTLVAYGNGLVTRHAYDPQTLRLVRMRTERHRKPDGLTYRPTGAAIQDFGYDYDLAGNIVTIKDRAPKSGIPNSVFGLDTLDRSFTYHPTYRLASATGRECAFPPPALPWSDAPQCHDVTQTRAYREEYDYDPTGNMTRLSHRAGAWGFTRRFALAPVSNRLSIVTSGATDWAYVYDFNGNLVSEAASRQLEWDHADRLRVYRTQTASSEPSIHAQYLYDAGGQRVKKLVRKQGGQLEVTIYIDGLFEHHRSVHAGATQENNVLHAMDDQSRIALIRVGAPFARDVTPPLQYHLGDHLGSSNLITDATGSWLVREEHTPYGETTFGSFARKRYRFLGKERDDESGLYYHGARYYAPWLIRWVSCDPSGPHDGANLYCFVRNNPMTLIDVSGLQSRETPNAPAANGAIGHVAPMKRQARARYKSGKRMTESEHVLPRSQLETLTANTATGGSDYGGAQYRADATVRVEREMALTKTHVGPSADNPSSARLKQKVRGGGSINYRDDVFVARIDNAKRARDAVTSSVSDEAIHRAALGQDANLFRLQTANESGGIAKGLGGVSEFQIEEWSGAATHHGGAHVPRSAWKRGASKVLKVFPFVGVPAGVAAAVSEWRKGNYVASGVEAIGLIPGVGDALDAARLLGAAGSYLFSRPDGGGGGSLVGRVEGGWIYGEAGSRVFKPDGSRLVYLEGDH